MKQLMNTKGYTPTNHVHTHTTVFLAENTITLYLLYIYFSKIEVVHRELW
jgi:hypothetical protein